MCHVTFHVSPVTNANSHRPSPCLLPHCARTIGWCVKQIFLSWGTTLFIPKNPKTSLTQLLYKPFKTKPAFGRHWISWRVRIVAPIKNIICQMSHVMLYLSPVTCHQQPQPQTLPQLTPPLCTVGWFNKTEPKKEKKKKLNHRNHWNLPKNLPILAISFLTRGL